MSDQTHRIYLERYEKKEIYVRIEPGVTEEVITDIPRPHTRGTSTPTTYDFGRHQQTDGTILCLPYNVFGNDDEAIVNFANDHIAEALGGAIVSGHVQKI